jgi:sugar/nucleoside kinase (ribokinase family)
LRDEAAEPLWPRRRSRVARSLVGLGQISLDRVGVVARWPRRGEKQVLEEELLLPGGQIATALLAAAQQGVPGALVAAVGVDEAAQQALAPLRAAGVDVSDVRAFPGVATRQAWLLCERDSAERTIFERRDPALRLRAEDVPPSRVESAAALLVDAEHPEASLRAVALARRAGVATLCDVERADEASWAILREVDFPIVSQGFADECWSGSSAEAALARLVGPATRMAVLTRGARGALARWGDRVLEVPALRIDALDTTGAGDVFRGSFAVALLAGCGARDVLEWANAAAGLACLGRGAQGALPRAAEVEARLRRVG